MNPCYFSRDFEGFEYRPTNTYCDAADIGFGHSNGIEELMVDSIHKMFVYFSDLLTILRKRLLRPLEHILKPLNYLPPPCPSTKLNFPTSPSSIQQGARCIKTAHIVCIMHAYFNDKYSLSVHVPLHLFISCINIFTFKVSTICLCLLAPFSTVYILDICIFNLLNILKQFTYSKI